VREITVASHKCQILSFRRHECIYSYESLAWVETQNISNARSGLEYDMNAYIPMKALLGLKLKTLVMHEVA